jgi:carotenoid cleavage dioxygenase-like enzyme
MARFVRTSKLQQEEYYGAAKFLKIGDMVGTKGILFFLLHLLRIKLGVLDISHGVGTANTALVYHNRKLLALYEGDKPCECFFYKHFLCFSPLHTPVHF